MRTSFLCLLFFSAFSNAVVYGAEAIATLCSKNESVLFSCPSRKKIISICATNLSSDGGSVQYRFGTAGAPEIELPQKPDQWRNSTVSRHLVLAGGGGTYVAFLNPPYRYIVYSATSGHWGMKAGAAIEKEGHVIRHYSCTQKRVSIISPDFLEKNNFHEDPDDTFLLP